MNQPLGITIGNSLEIAESIAIFKNRGPRDVHDLTVCISRTDVGLRQKAPSLEIATGLAEDALRDGRALNAFKQLIQAPGAVIRRWLMIRGSYRKQHIEFRLKLSKTVLSLRLIRMP